MSSDALAAGRDRATLMALTAMGLAIDDRSMSEDAATADILDRTGELLDAEVSLWWSDDNGTRRSRPAMHAAGNCTEVDAPDDVVRRVARLGVPERAVTATGIRVLAPARGPHGVLAVLDVHSRIDPATARSDDLLAVISVAARLGSSLTVRRLIESLQRQADIDTLTGLPNRSVLLRHLDAELAAATTGLEPPTVVFIDVDRFKDINDSLGHAAGDEVLKAVAARLTGHVRGGDLVARFGGDEFVLVLRGLPAADVESLLDRITAVPLVPQTLGSARVYVTMSAGVAEYQRGGDAETMLRHADAAMYRAKTSAVRRWEHHADSALDVSVAALRLDGELVEAIEGDQLFCEFQPIVDAESLEVVAHEALVRWNHPAHGRLEPGAFIPTSERTGLVVPLSAWVLADALRSAATWPEHVDLSVNVSARQVSDPDLSRKILAALELSGVDPGRLIVEITETAVMDDARSTALRLTALHDAGVRVAVDDFGTGYTSINHVQQLPIDILKIDRSFTAHLGSDAGIELMGALRRLASALGVQTVAEGVETADQLALAREIGFDAVQGYFLARPAPAHAVQHAVTVRHRAHRGTDPREAVVVGRCRTSLLASSAASRKQTDELSARWRPTTTRLSEASSRSITVAEDRDHQRWQKQRQEDHHQEHGERQRLGRCAASDRVITWLPGRSRMIVDPLVSIVSAPMPT